MTDSEMTKLLHRIADALDRMAPATTSETPLADAEGYVWRPDQMQCSPVSHIARLPLSALCGISPQLQQLYDNTKRFAEGKLANNALLWGARGTGKSSLVKAVHGALIAEGFSLKIVEIAREDIASLPDLMSYLAHQEGRFIIFCDDLAFEGAETSYKALKAALEGGLTGRPSNIVFYATSNRRHLMSRQMIDNERSTAINPSEAVEEKISLSDRFGLWLGFHALDQEQYLEIIAAYITYYNIPTSFEDERLPALQWAMARGNRSGRTAHQFIIDCAARHNVMIR